MFGNVYGLDLGTSKIRIYDGRTDSIIKEKNVIAVMNGKEIIAFGDEAYDMFEKAPANIEVVFPMKEGVISRFYDMQDLLAHMLGTQRFFSLGSKYLIAVPTDVTEVEKRAFYDLVLHSVVKASKVGMVERAVADAVGMGLDVIRSPGIFTVNLGAETTEISVVASGGLVLSRILKTGGKNLDLEIISRVRAEKDFLIGRVTAEALRAAFGVGKFGKDECLSVPGRDLITRIPRIADIPASVVTEAVKSRVSQIPDEIQSLLERTPPEALSNIRNNGIYITGGLSLMKGLPELIEERIHMRVNVAPDPEFATVNGLKTIVRSKQLKRLTYSMVRENDRWMK